LEQAIQLHRIEFLDEGNHSREYVLPPQLLLLVWVGIIVLPWAGLFWLAAFLGRLAA